MLRKALCILLLLATWAGADYLRVSRDATLKEQPDRDAPVLGRYESGDELALLDGGEKRNGYYRVRDAGTGRDGWLYKTLARRHEGPLPSSTNTTGTATTSAGNSFRIHAGRSSGTTADTVPLTVGSWNIKWFGSKTPSSYDFVTMADFIEECDVVAVQELTAPNHEACIESLVDELAARGWSFAHVIGPSTGYRDNPEHGLNDYEERYAFLWNTRRVAPKGTPGPVSSPVLNNPVYRQVPYVADFKVTGGRGFDFRVLSVHTVYNAGINFVRRRELEAVRAWVTSSAADGERNLVAIGDFNANPDGQPHHFETVMANPSGFRILMDESRDAGVVTIRTTCPTKDSSTNPAYLRLPVYDHILVSTATSPALPANPMVRAGGRMGVYQYDDDPWWKANGWTRQEAIAAVSDHRPVWFTMIYTAEDLD